MPEKKPDEDLTTLAKKCSDASEAEDPGAALRAVVRPLYDEHQNHKSLVAGCVFCEGIIT